MAMGIAASSRFLPSNRLPQMLLTVAGTLATSCTHSAVEEEHQVSKQNQSLYVATPRVWSRSGRFTEIPVCWEVLDSSTATDRSLVRAAVETTWQAVSAVRFRGWGVCTPSATGIRIRVKDVGPYTLGLGTEVSGVKDGMVLNFTFTTWSPGCQRTRPYCISVGAIHEFGHALGFAHEQNRPDTPSWCTSEQGSDGDVVIGAWDLNSVMNYCNPLWTGDGKLSKADIEGVRATYGSGGQDWDIALSTGATLSAPQSQHEATIDGAEYTFLFDATGDGRADLIAVFASRGDLYVAPALLGSSAGSFGPLVPWLRGAASPASRYFVADVTGDGRADAVAFFSASGNWMVAASTGTTFLPYSLWKSGHGIGSTSQLLADVTGDGRADAVSFFLASGSFWVAPSTGTAFASYSKWKSDHGIGSSAQLLADVTGDGRADAVVYYAATGSWWVSPSNGTAFSAYSLWKTGHGTGSSTQLLADVTGDGKADAMAVFRNTGSFWVAPSSGAAFVSDSRWSLGLGTALSSGLNVPVLGDINADGKQDILLRWLR